MTDSAAHKVTGDHLRRPAYLYVRQSTLRQVRYNTESTQRQYALRERAIALGWSSESVTVIDTDLGRSGAVGSARAGFQQLVDAVASNGVGIVLGLEVSRLARNSTDWHALVEMCAFTDTLLLDEDGVYSPGDFNDRLLLGIKGTMSEAELHLIRARLLGGIRAAALRGELRVMLPTGLQYDPEGQVQLDPDSQVQDSLRHFFASFERLGSATAAVRHFREQGLLFPRRLLSGPCKGDTVWEALTHHRARQLLHNPRYAGAFVYGRRKTRRQPDGSVRVQVLPPAEWLVLLRDSHPGYISWERYQANRKQLQANCTAHGGGGPRKSPPREGPALLQGLAVCGLCGQPMTVGYYSSKHGPQPYYLCQRQGIQTASTACQRIAGAGIDRAVGEQLVAEVTPRALAAALQVQAELEARGAEADALRRQRVERARSEAEWAFRLLDQASRKNDLARAELENRWNAKLREVRAAEQELERSRKAAVTLDAAQRQKVRALAAEFPRVWNDSGTPQRERKRLARLLLADITLTQGDSVVEVGIRWRGGRSHELSIPRSLPGGKLRQTPRSVVAEIDALLDSHRDSDVARILNERGRVSGMGRPLHRRIVQKIRKVYGLKSRYERLRERGLLTVNEMAEQLGVTPGTVRRWGRAGLLRGHAYNDRPSLLYDPPGEDAPSKSPGLKLAERTPASPADVNSGRKGSVS